MIAQTAVVLTESVKSLNNGIRGFYFAVASLFLFVGPMHRHVHDTADSQLCCCIGKASQQKHLAIERYVEAMNAYEAERVDKGESAI